MIWIGILSLITTPVIAYLSQKGTLQNMNRQSIIIFSVVLLAIIPFVFFIATTGIPCPFVENCFSIFYYPLDLGYIPLSVYPWGYTRIELFGIPVQPPAIDGQWYPEEGMIFLSLMLMEYLASFIGWFIGILLSMKRFNILQRGVVTLQSEEEPQLVRTN